MTTTGTVGALGLHLRDYGAVIFDMDGVITDTATVHAAAWKQLFDETLPGLAGAQTRNFDIDRDYRRYVDGRTREDGVRAFLASRQIELPEGPADDPAQGRTVRGLAARTQQLFEQRLARAGAIAFPSSTILLERLHAAGMATALVTTSRNSVAVLDSAGVRDLFDARVDGSDAQRLSLPGKPDPAMFTEAAHRLDLDPGECVVIEDAEAGVQAGVAGGFGLVVGVDRVGNRAGLRAAGAHVIVEDLAALQVDLPVLDSAAHWCGGAVAESDPWLLSYDGFDPALEATREALCTLANGYFGTRGAAPGSTADGVHYPGTYLAGVYNRLTTNIGERHVENEHLVNAPDWTSLTLCPPDAAPYLPGGQDLISSSQQLDLRRGVLTRVCRYQDHAGRTTRVTSRSLVHLTRRHLAVLETTVEAEDWAGPLLVRCGVDGRVENRNVAEDRQLEGRHLRPVTARQVDRETVLLDMVTSQSQVHIAVAARTRLRPGRFQETTGQSTKMDHLHVERALLDGDPGYVGHQFELRLHPGKPVTIEKVVAVVTSRDPAISTAASAATAAAARAPAAVDLVRSHEAAWERRWQRFDIDIRAGRRQSLALNLNTFHVLQTVPAAGPGLDAGVPARGLHGEGYRGHIFWDEMFIYPMLTLRRPELTRSLLGYRSRRLDEARAAAVAGGWEGAMFPWQSGSDGREETPSVLFNPRSGTWMADNSARQRHVGLAAVYGVWQYYQATADLGFLRKAGAEIMVEVTRFFASLATYDEAEDRFDIAGVMGPDEFHDGYPQAPGKGLRNNAYTNVMVVWAIKRTLQVLDLLANTDAATIDEPWALRPDERDRWNHLRHRLRVPFHADGVISQFEDYEALAEFDWASYRARYGDIGRLDLILAAENDSTNNYRLSKQADVLMLFYLFSAEELRELLDPMGYPLPPATIRNTIDFYLARTTHGSTLSRLVHSWVLARSDRHRSWSLFTQALDSDLADIQGGTTREGVHLGAMAGTVDMVLRCYTGLEIRDDVLWLHPVLPPELPRVTFEIAYRGQPIHVELNRERVLLESRLSDGEPITVCVEGQRSVLWPGTVQVVPLPPHGRSATPLPRPGSPAAPLRHRGHPTQEP